MTRDKWKTEVGSSEEPRNDTGMQSMDLEVPQAKSQIALGAFQTPHSSQCPQNTDTAVAETK